MRRRRTDSTSEPERSFAAFIARLEERIALWTQAQEPRPRALLVFFALLFAIQISPWWYATPDAAAYLSIARSIAAGGPMTDLGNPHLAYPIGYPLLVSPAFLAGKRPFLLISVLHWIMAMVLMLGVYRWARRVAAPAALLVTALAMANVSLWNYYHRTLSEIAFMASTVWASEALDTALAARRSREFIRWLLGGAFLLALASLIRETGVLFAGGLGIVMVRALLTKGEGQRRLLALGTIAALPAIAVVIAFVRHDLFTAAHSPVVLGTHLSGFLNAGVPFMSRLSEGARLRISEIGRLTVPGMFKTYGRTGQWLNINMAVYIPVSGLAGWGWWKMMRHGNDVFVATLPFYLALYVLWVFDADTRYMLPMLPVLFASLWYALERLGRHRTAVMAVILAAHLGVALGYWITKDAPRARRCNAHWSAITRMARAIRSRPGPVAALDIPRCPVLLMAFELDRPVAEAKTVGEIGARAQWILAKAGERADPNFTSAAGADGFALLQRRGP